MATPTIPRSNTKPTGPKPRPSRHRDVDDWWDLPDTIPSPDSATVQRGRRWRHLITVYVWAAVILLPLALLAIFLLAGRQLGDDPAPSQTVAGTEEGAEAQVLLERWIGQNPSPLPGGRVVALIDATSQTPAPTHPGEVVNYRIATYRFVVADSDQTLYTTGVQLAITPDGPTLLAQPALLPIPANGTTGQGGQWPWPGVEAGTPQPVFTAAVNAWLAAYTSGDPSALKQVVGDPDPGRSYLPLSGVAMTDPSVGAVGWLWGTDQDRTRDALPHQAMLRVSVGALWSGQTPEPGGTVPTLTYDLLLDRADTAAPVVVARGNPGASLSPYGNAFTDRTLPTTTAPPPSSGTATSPGPSTSPTGPGSGPPPSMSGTAASTPKSGGQ